MLLRGLSINAAFAAGIAIVLCFSSAASAQSAKSNTKSTASVCQRCHDAGVPLPASHPKVKGAALSECADCHASQIGHAKPYGFASRLHRAHVSVQLDCTSCHAYTPGKRFASTNGKVNLGAFEIEQYERLRKAVGTWANSKGLAATHGTKQNLSCGALPRQAVDPG